ncbi:helix-turn-helix domain-containing protein [Streptomyces sp. NPDC046371]|uniref:helix-turn-helix domain-containing protein n=1 Tax=Streptomyces sp. NPDC046371 TaxID=3154916 RepID=UPI0033C80E4D
MGLSWRALCPACPHGHPFPENLYIDTRGWTCCRQCWRTEPDPPDPPDPVAIDRAVAGDPPERLSARERAAAVARLDARGLSAEQVAERIRCTPRTVYRIRKRIRQGTTR